MDRDELISNDLEKTLEIYINLLEQRLYFEAHEVLEETWHPLRKANHPLKNFIKGLINASIAFEHIKRDRPKSKDRAKRVIISYERYKNLAIEHPTVIETIEKIENIKKSKNL